MKISGALRTFEGSQTAEYSVKFCIFGGRIYLFELFATLVKKHFC